MRYPYDTLVVYCDGAAEPNPGPSSWGFVFKTGRGSVVHEDCGYLGIGTNNQAEYEAVLRAARAAREFGCNILMVLSDSRLVIEQLSGRWKCKNLTLATLREQTLTELRHFEDYQLRWIPREENVEADALSIKALEDAGFDTGRARAREHCPGCRCFGVEGEAQGVAVPTARA